MNYEQIKQAAFVDELEKIAFNPLKILKKTLSNFKDGYTTGRNLARQQLRQKDPVKYVMTAKPGELGIIQKKV